GLDGILHCQVQAGRRFSAARDTHQDHVGLFQTVHVLTIVVRQAEVDGLNAIVVALGHATGVRTAHGTAGFHAQGAFNVSYKGTKQVQEGAVGRANDVRHLGVNQGAKYQRLLALFLGALVDAISDRLGFLDRIDEGNPDGLKFELSELRQDGVAESFGGNARAVGNDKDGTINRRKIGRAACRESEYSEKDP